MTRVTALLATALGLATLLSTHPGLAQAEYRTIDAQRISKYKGAITAYERALKLMDKIDVIQASVPPGLCHGQPLGICSPVEPGRPPGRRSTRRRERWEPEDARSSGSTSTRC